MCDVMSFPATVDEFMEEYKVVDSEHIYSNGMEMVPIFRMKQWFEHEANHNAEPGKMMDDTVSRQDAIDALSHMISEDRSGVTVSRENVKSMLLYLPSVQTEIIHCKDCLYKKICSWKNQGATFCSFGERGKAE